MIGSALFGRTSYFLFSIAKKAKMELTLRTPYNTVLNNFDGFSRIITKSNEAALIIQNRTPPALYVLPPGPLKVRLTQDVKGVTGDYMHTGGWAIVHPDNTCEINVMDLVERKEIKVDEIERTEVKEAESVAGRFAAKNRKLVSKIFTKRATNN